MSVVSVTNIRYDIALFDFMCRYNVNEMISTHIQHICFVHGKAHSALIDFICRYNVKEMISTHIADPGVATPPLYCSFIALLVK